MFQHLNEEEQRALVRQFQERHVRAGDVITQAGQRSDAVYIVGSGVFEMQGAMEGKDFPLGELTRESVFGQLSVVANSPCSITVVTASEHGLLWELHRQEIQASQDVIARHALLPR
jgi:CRP-like cAMP-binding protein